MINITARALQRIQEFMAEQQEPYAGVRVEVQGGGCSGFQYAMNLERESREGDQIVKADGFQIFVDEQSMLYLEGTEIDYEETLQGRGFRFKNPNVTGSCGCGESFQF